MGTGGTTMADRVQRFSQTSGRVFGVLALLVVLGVVVTILTDRDGQPSYAGLALALFFGALAWSALLRPRLELGASELVMRNMVTTVRVPLPAIESVSVRQVLVVFAGDKRYTSAAVGRSRRQLHREGGRSGASGSQGGAGGFGLIPVQPSAPEAPETAASSYGLYVEQTIRTRVADALAQQGIKARSAEQARQAEGIVRRPAVPEIVALVGSAAAFLVLVLG